MGRLTSPLPQELCSCRNFNDVLYSKTLKIHSTNTVVIRPVVTILTTKEVLFLIAIGFLYMPTIRARLGSVFGINHHYFLSIHSCFVF